MKINKFRIWDNLKNCWHRNNSQAIHIFGENTLMGCLDIRQDGSRVKLLELNDLIEMQFTGLKDKNGIEIYESDLLKYESEDGYVIYTVEWNDKSAAFTSVNRTNEDAGYIGYRTICGSQIPEIVGNIYDKGE